MLTNNLFIPVFVDSDGRQKDAFYFRFQTAEFEWTHSCGKLRGPKLENSEFPVVVKNGFATILYKVTKT